MKTEVSTNLNIWRLREGPMATDNDAMYEGCFIIPSAKMMKDAGPGHPFEYHDIFQVKSSELPAPGSEESWEHVTAICKRDERGHLEQRILTLREAYWLRDQFWPEHQTATIYLGGPDCRERTDHRIMHIFRDPDFGKIPDLFREKMLLEDPQYEGGYGPEVETIADMVRQKRGERMKSDQDEIEAGRARMLHDARQIIQFAEQLPTKEGDGRTVKFSADAWARLAKVLQIE